MVDQAQRLHIVGELNLDVVTRYPAGVPVFCRGDNSLRLGGSIASLGQEARRRFTHICGVFAVGDDLAARFLVREAEAWLDDLHPIVEGNAQSGVVIVRFEGGERLLVGVAEGASQALRPDSVAGVLRSVVLPGDVVVVDGYLLLGAKGVDLAVAAAVEARARGGICAIDLVPHTIDTLVAGPDLLRAVRAFDVVISESRTLAPVLGLVAREEPSAVVAAFQASVPGAVLILRYGARDIEFSDVVFPDGRVATTHEPDEARLQALGYGDQLLADELITILEMRDEPPP